MIGPALLGQNAAHLARVLRARVGQEFDIVCGEQVRLGTIVSVSDERVEFSLGDALAGGCEREIGAGGGHLQVRPAGVGD